MRKTTMILALFLTAGSPQARQFWVSPRGDDSAQGNREAPWKTFTKVSAGIQPGDTVNALAGVYESKENRAVFAPPYRLSGDSAHWTVVRRWGDGEVYLRGGETNISVQLELTRFLELRGLVLEEVSLVEASRIRLIDNEFRTRQTPMPTFAPVAAIRGGGNKFWIEGNRFTTSSAAIDLVVFPTPDSLMGPWFPHPDGEPHGAHTIVRRNVFRGQEGDAIRINEGDSSARWDVDRILIENNIVDGVWGRALSLTRSKDATVRNNYFRAQGMERSAQTGGRITPTAAYFSGSRVKLVSNVLAPDCNGADNCVAALFDSVPGKGSSRCSHNLVWDRLHPGTGLIVDRKDYGWQPGGFGPNLLGIDPKVGADLHPLAGSPLIDAGWNQSAPFDDFDSMPRPAGRGIDIGPFELQSTTSARPGEPAPAAAMTVHATAAGLLVSAGPQARSLHIATVDGRTLARLSSTEGRFSWTAPRSGAIVARALDAQGRELSRAIAIAP